jgi:methionine sulfoxide reductase heme-binding subunit
MNTADPPIHRRTNLVEGWRLTGTMIAVIFAAATVLAFGIGGSNGARAALLLTGRTSLALFMLAFTAAALHQLRPNTVTSWMRRNRRYLGVSFAGSHAIHAIAIALLVASAGAHAIPPPLKQVSLQVGMVPLYAGYVCIAAMTATSFNRTAAFIGRKAWHWLHLVGSYVIWADFVEAYGPRAIRDPSFIPAFIIVIVALILRLTARAQHTKKGN